MTAELAWTTIAGKRVLPVLGYAGMCGTSGSREERISCALYTKPHGDCAGQPAGCSSQYPCEAATFPDNTIFITEDQLPEYLGRKLIGAL